MLEDFLNTRRILSESERGEKGRRFRYLRHGSKPDDFLHAVNMAYSLIRLYYNQALVRDPGARMLLRNAIDGGSGSVAGGGLAAALSSYARTPDSYD